MTVFLKRFLQVAVTTFAIYVFTGNVLTASKAFVALSLFNVMRFPLVMLPDVIVACIQVGNGSFNHVPFPDKTRSVTSVTIPIKATERKSFLNDTVN